MSIAVGWAVAEVRELVLAYERQPHGSKMVWLAGQGVSHHQLSRWRRALFDGDLDRGLVPRDGGAMTSVPQRRHMAKQEATRDTEIEQLQARVRELEEANDVLGKAIGLLHAQNVHGPDELPRSPGQESS